MAALVFPGARLAIPPSLWRALFVQVSQRSSSNMFRPAGNSVCISDFEFRLELWVHVGTVIRNASAGILNRNRQNKFRKSSVFRLTIPHHNRTGGLQTCAYPFIIQPLRSSFLPPVLVSSQRKTNPNSRRPLRRTKSL